MDTLIAFLSLALFIAFIVGLIKPSLVRMPSRKRSSAVYYLILNKDPLAVVKTTFRGTNAYGGVVKQTVAARVNVRTGEVDSILDN